MRRISLLRPVALHGANLLIGCLFLRSVWWTGHKTCGKVNPAESHRRSHRPRAPCGLSLQCGSRGGTMIPKTTVAPRSLRLAMGSFRSYSVAPELRCLVGDTRVRRWCTTQILRRSQLLMRTWMFLCSAWFAMIARLANPPLRMLVTTKRNGAMREARRKRTTDTTTIPTRQRRTLTKTRKTKNPSPSCRSGTVVHRKGCHPYQREMTRILRMEMTSWLS
mmetsp:Transcript_3884/g.9142  ORF Transcript_3884/g.9142 Transcript_3884/m.9142 type:complete len:220 (-) Transcript_3884:214-873(-)